MPSGFTYTFANAITIASKMVKGIPTSGIDATMCDIISTDMYRFRPWAWTMTNIAPGTVALTDGVQDFSGPLNIYRFIRGRIVRTDTTPDQYLDLTVRKTLTPDLTPRGYSAISCIANEESVGKLRLESAVQVPTGTTLEIQGEYQIVPTKITLTTQSLWFPDEYITVLIEGLLYWYYKIADDPKWSTQFKIYQDALLKMAVNEDFPATDQMFPDTPLGVGRAYTGALNIFGVS